MTSDIKNIKGVLFDFDGVLVDSLPAHLKAWNLAYLNIFGEELSENQKSHIKGMSTRSIAKFLCGKDLQMFEKIITTKDQIAASEKSHINEIPGARNLIEKLTDKNIPFGIVSNAPKKFIANIIDRKKIVVPFFFGREDYYRPKPDPEPYIKGLKELGFEYVDRKNIVFFEDSPHGLRSGKDAGLFPIGISSQHPDRVLIDAGAKIVFKDHTESMQFILSRIHKF